MFNLAWLNIKEAGVGGKVEGGENGGWMIEDGKGKLGRQKAEGGTGNMNHAKGVVRMMPSIALASGR
jgi:hypothetical protein